MRALGLILVASLGTGCIIEPPDLIRLDGGGDFDGGGRPYTPPDINWNWDGGFPSWDGGIPSRDGGGAGSPSDGGGGGGDGGTFDAGTPPRASFPGNGANGDPGTGVLWLVRIDRGTASLASSYTSIIQTMTQELTHQGFDIRATVVGSLYDGTLYWAGEGKSLSAAALKATLENASAQSGASVPAVCSSQTLTQAGARLSEATPNASYTARPFMEARSALLVVTLDHGARPVDYSARCDTDGVTPAERFGGGAYNTNWLNIRATTAKWNLSRAQTRFLFVSTSEKESYSQLRERCAAMSNFPRTGLDALAPSSIPFYGPFSSGLNAFQKGLGTEVDLCRAVAQDWAGDSRDFAKSWVNTLSQPR